MLNKIWPIFLIVSILFALVLGNLPKLNTGIFNSTQEAINLTLSFIGTMSLWCGMMKIAMETKLINKIKKILNPIFTFLFKGIKEDDEIYKYISMNIIANILGLGNAATPLGIKAMKNLQNKNNNKNEITDSMAILMVINTASIQIIPTTVIAIRNSMGSLNPTKMIFPIWIATICAALAAIFSAKIFMKRW